MFKKLIIILLGVMCVTMVKPTKKASANSSKFITIVPGNLTDEQIDALV